MASPDWNDLPKEHSLARFAADLPAILENVGYHEMYGAQLKASTEAKPTPHTTLVILQKFLRANANDLEKAKTQLTDALRWRKEYKPLEAKEKIFDTGKFGGLGFVTKIKGVKQTENEEDVATFNVYGAAAKDPKKTFGDTDKFVRWRVALMEITLAELNLNAATKPVPDYGQGPDPYQALQIHDYLSVSFFRQPGEIKQSSQKIIDMFQKYYPETVSYKYFVNVPLVMQWMMGAIKALMSKDSIQKMTWLTYGNQLSSYIGDDIPKEYGGSSASLQDKGLTPKYEGTMGEINGKSPSDVDAGAAKENGEESSMGASATTATA